MKDRPQKASRLWRYSDLGIELAATIAGLTLLGYWIDHKLGTRPKGVLAGAALGIVGGFYNFIRQALLMGKQQEPDENGQDDADREQ